MCLQHPAAARKLLHIVPVAFYVHGNIIKKMVFIKKTKHFRICSVCIQFHKISKSFDFDIKSGSSRYSVGSPPLIQTPSRIPLLFFRKASTSSSEMEGSFSGERTRFPF